MRFINCLNHLRGALRRQPQGRRPQKCQSRLSIEQLEDRMVPSNLFVDLAGNAHYVGPAFGNDIVTLSQVPVPLAPQSSNATIHPPVLFADTITDVAEAITVTGPGASRWFGTGTHQVSTILTIPSLLVNVASGPLQRVNVQAIDAPTLVTYVGPGNLFVSVGAGNLSGLQASLTVKSVFGGLTHLSINDYADTPRTVTLGSNFMTFSGVTGPIIYLGGVGSVDIFGSNSDTFVEQTGSSTAPVTVHGAPGGSTLVSSFGNNDWLITGINAGTLHNVSFVNVQNLRGGPLSARDTFHFNDKMFVSGSIVGAGKPGYLATLDYSQYTVPLTVDLKLNVAIVGFIKTAVANINQVFGGQANNILVGDSDNLLRGGAGRDILISGGGTSTLQAGAGEAVMIGAHCVFETNLVALNKLMAEWSHTYVANPILDYRIRVNHLMNGGGLNDPFRLNQSTVFPQPGVTTLITGGGLDFLFTDPGDILAKPLRPFELNVFV
jgi:Ca2+-binding RTX toxin-like protein